MTKPYLMRIKHDPKGRKVRDSITEELGYARIKFAWFHSTSNELLYWLYVDEEHITQLLLKYEYIESIKQHE